MRFLTCTLLFACPMLPLGSQTPPRQTESDAYTRYELLAPGSAKFRITYEVTATSSGATHYFNPIRKGSIATDESVLDRATGKPLAFDVVGAVDAGRGGVPGRDSTQTYIRVRLSRAVPPDGGEARLLILKTYQDSLSYFTLGDTIVFTRVLGIKRNAGAAEGVSARVVELSGAGAPGTGRPRGHQLLERDAIGGSGDDACRACSRHDDRPVERGVAS